MKAFAFLLLCVSLVLAAEPPPSSAPPPAELAPGKISIDADSFAFENETHIATYRGHVLVIDPAPSPDQVETRMISDLLTVKMPPAGHRIENIVAEGNVVIVQGPNRATGNRAVYLADNDILTLTGKPVLYSQQGKMLCETIVFDRLSKRMRALGPVHTEIDASQIGKTNIGVLPGHLNDAKKVPETK